MHSPHNTCNGKSLLAGSNLTEKALDKQSFAITICSAAYEMIAVLSCDMESREQHMLFHPYVVGFGRQSIEDLPHPALLLLRAVDCCIHR